MKIPEKKSAIIVLMQDDSIHIAHWNDGEYSIGLDKMGCNYCGGLCSIKFDEKDKSRDPKVKKWAYLYESENEDSSLTCIIKQPNNIKMLQEHIDMFA